MNILVQKAVDQNMMISKYLSVSAGAMRRFFATNSYDKNNIYDNDYARIINIYDSTTIIPRFFRLTCFFFFFFTKIACLRSRSSVFNKHRFEFTSAESAQLVTAL